MMTREELLKVGKPILFNTEMVQAILEGRKSVTRRSIKLDLGMADTDKNDSSYLYISDEYGDYHHAKDLCRYRVGDILYVRETWLETSPNDCTCYECNGGCIPKYVYRADGIGDDESYKWKPSIHMPKDLARIFLKVTDVRVERLQDITEEQAIKEGFISTAKKNPQDDDYKGLYARERFIEAMKDIYPGIRMDSFLWVIEFERVEI